MSGDIIKFLCPQQALVKFEQGHIDLVDIVVSPVDEIFHNNIKLAAVGQGVARPGNQVPGLVQIQLQRHSKCQRRRFGGSVGRIVPDLGEVFSVHIGPFVYLGDLFSAAVDKRERSMGRALTPGEYSATWQQANRDYDLGINR